MVNYRLDLYNYQNVSVKTLRNCPLKERIPISLTYQINDVRMPEKGIGSKSKTIIIPGTKEVNIFFEDAYNVNTSLQTFNPNLKVLAIYWLDEFKQFEGSLQIVKIRIDERTRNISYECQIIGQETTFFTAIKDKYIYGNADPSQDLDFSEYDHELTFTDITNSWTNNCKVNGTPTALANGEGYTYPMVDRGTNNSNLSVMRPKDFRGVLFRRQILKKIFDAAGYTWTSAFLDSAGFKRKQMPPTDIAKVDATTIANNKFYAEADGTQTPFSTAPAYNPYINYVPFGSQSLANVVEFQNEISDPGSVFITPVFQPGQTSNYNIKGSLALKFKITRDTGSGPLDVSANMSAITSSGVHIIVYNQTQSFIVGTYDLDVLNGTFGLAANAFNAQVSLNNIPMIAGDVHTIIVKVASMTLQYTAATSGATWNLETHVMTGSNFSAELTSEEMFEGAPVYANDLLPRDYKQSDFVTDLRKEFNLFFLQDKNNPKNIIIEPRPTFYSNNPADVQNWDKKHDRNSGVETIPAGDLDFIKLKCKHADDGDYFNKLHLDEFKEPYGTYNKDVKNDFVKNEQEVKMLIAPTPYAVNYATGLVVPTIIKKDNNVIAQVKIKPRSWHWSGLINLPIGLSWKFLYNNDASSATYTTMPASGHTDNPYNPTLDLSWGVPKRHYYTIPAMTWTTNNLYNSGYSQYINEITDINSKIIRTKFYLTPRDIADFDFRKPISCVIDREFCICLVNKIEDYDPMVRQPVMVELLKLTKYAPFSSSIVAVDTGNGGPSNSQMKVNNNISNSPKSVNYGNESMIVGGSGNSIALNSTATLLNCTNVTVVGNVVNFIGIGLENMVIDSTYSNSTVNGNEVTTTLTTGSYDLTKSSNNKTVYLDASGGDITLVWDPFTMNDAKLTIIREDGSANKIYLDTTVITGTENYKGAGGFPIDLAMVQWDTLKLTSKGDTILTTT